MKQAYEKRRRQIQDKKQILENIQRLAQILQSEITEDEREQAESEVHLREVEAIIRDVTKLE